jgi:hypothetical protein
MHPTLSRVRGSRFGFERNAAGSFFDRKEFTTVLNGLPSRHGGDQRKSKGPASPSGPSLPRPGLKRVLSPLALGGP